MGSTVVLWQDNQPVYMASNLDQVDLVCNYKQYNKKQEEYVSLPKLNLNTK